MAEPSPEHQPLALVAALTYARRGWRVVPILPGEKRPGLEHGLNAWQDMATTNEDIIRRWWTRFPAHGVGIVAGPESGIFVLDVDVSHGKIGDESLAELEAEYGALPETVEVITGSGGRHIYFRWPAGMVSTSAGQLGLGLDIRGEGGQVLAPPTIHPETGRKYEWEIEHHPRSTAIAEAPAWLIDLLTKPSEDKARREKTHVDGDSPVDHWKREQEWAVLLEADGATFVKTRVDRHERLSYELWTRPGKEPRHGTSATLYYRGSEVLKVFTANWKVTNPETGEVVYLEDGATYTIEGYWCATRFNSDWGAMTRALREQGYGAPIDEPDLEALLPEPQADNQPPSPPRPATPDDEDDDGDEEDEWPLPAALDAPAVELPPWPVHVLPAWAAEHMAEAARSLQVPVDLCAQQGLGAMAVLALGAKVHITSEWPEYVCLWLATVMGSGTGKSAADKVMLAPLRAIEAERIDALHHENIRNAALRKAADDEVKALEAKLNKGATIDEVIDATLARDAIPGHKGGRLIADDATPEALTVLLQQNDERLGIVSSEAELLDMVCGMYGDKTKVANLNVYLKGWSADRLTNDRKGSGTVLLHRPLLGVAIAVQPYALEQLRGNRQAAGRGFVARFMFSVPPDLRGKRDRRQSGQGRLSETAVGWNTGLRRIAARAEQTPDVRFTPDATELWLDWLQETEDRLGEGGDLRAVTDWTAKLQATTARFAGLLALAEDRDAVDVGTLQRAFVVADYWVAHMQAVVATVEPDDRIPDAKRIVADLAAAEGRRMTVRDLEHAHYSVWNRRAKEERAKPVEVVTAALALLVERGWVRIVPQDAARDGRKASPMVVLNPNAETTRKVPPVMRSVATVAQSLEGENQEHTLSPSPQPPLDLPVRDSATIATQLPEATEPEGLL